MPASQPTPLPWKSHAGSVWQDGAPGTHTLVAKCNNPADPDLIVRAVNCHAVLVRALRNLVSRYEHIEAEKAEPCEFMTAARAALTAVDATYALRNPTDGIAPGIAYVLMLDTVCQGSILAERDGDGRPIVYATKNDAERELADHLAIQYRQVADGERAFDEVADDEGVEPVTIQMNGDIVDAGGRVIGNTDQPLPY